MSDLPEIDSWGFRRGALIYPQPIAIACGRVLRAGNPQERIDACLKGGEILARYLSALSLASVAGRATDPLPDNIKPLRGNLSFGHYLSLVQAVSLCDQHPLFPHLGPFRRRGKGKNKLPGKADAPLVALLNLRNEHGHDLASMSSPRALTVLNRDKPAERLLAAFQALEGVLSLPLFVLDNIRFRDRRPVGQRLLLMGEAPDPIPEDVALSQPLDACVPYVAVDERVLALPPLVLFELIEEQAAYRLVFLDSVDVEKRQLRFKTLESLVLDRNHELHDHLQALFDGELRSLEVMTRADGETFQREWSMLRPHREALGRQAEGIVPWEDFDRATLDAFAARLPGEVRGDSVASISRALLDGRTRGLDAGDLRQLTLLFGTEKAVRAALGRDMYDLRVTSEPGSRWDERVVGNENLLVALSTAIDFFARHVGIGTDQAPDLSTSEGSADYIAMRETLVNQFIHQDYSDRSAATQIELGRERASFFNTGFSLVAEDQLAEGGRSQARNPLIARALRLIGYAELAGSGLRALQYEWRKAKRRPPAVVSDRAANTFSLTLDWREVPDAYDTVWKDRLGVRLNAFQAAVLNLATDPAGITLHQAAAGTGGTLAESREALRFLVHQVLLEEIDNQFYLRPHLKELLA